MSREDLQGNQLLVHNPVNLNTSIDLVQMMLDHLLLQSLILLQSDPFLGACKCPFVELKGCLDVVLKLDVLIDVGLQRFSKACHYFCDLAAFLESYHCSVCKLNLNRKIIKSLKCSKLVRIRINLFKLLSYLLPLPSLHNMSLLKYIPSHLHYRSQLNFYIPIRAAS